MSDEKKKYKISHDRPSCIGCNVCVSLCGRFWEMNDQDGQADFIGDEEITEEDFKCNMNAAEACPVNIIHITNLESGEKLI